MIPRRSLAFLAGIVGCAALELLHCAQALFATAGDNNRLGWPTRDRVLLVAQSSTCAVGCSVLHFRLWQPALQRRARNRSRAGRPQGPNGGQLDSSAPPLPEASKRQGVLAALDGERST